jgi:hypothetical protein
VYVRSGVVLTPSQTGLRVTGSSFRIDVEPLQPREIDDHAAVDGAETGRTVSFAAHREGGIVGAGELDGMTHVGDVTRADDQCRLLVDGSVPDQPRLVVLGVGRFTTSPPICSSRELIAPSASSAYVESAIVVSISAPDMAA